MPCRTCVYWNEKKGICTLTGKKTKESDECRDYTDYFIAGNLINEEMGL